MPKDTEQRRQQKAKWRAEHPGYFAAKNKEWRLKHLDYLAVEGKKWRAKNPGHSKNWRVNNFTKSFFMDVKGRAKRTKKFFSLTLQWVEKKLAAGICEQTGRPFDFKRGDDILSPRRNPWFPSVSRIDSSLGYTEANCQIVCAMYNFAKADWDDVNVLEMAKWLVKNKNVKT